MHICIIIIDALIDIDNFDAIEILVYRMVHLVIPYNLNIHPRRKN
jgi:hypothetical protein